mmetsp:Transcript_38385/g.121265  ORF Transcript_38385/g.121265 Transcript_38385/m.121265 type:complete len:279 (+) Transcript_38385:771-1607(+)
MARSTTPAMHTAARSSPPAALGGSSLFAPSTASGSEHGSASPSSRGANVARRNLARCSQSMIMVYAAAIAKKFGRSRSRTPTWKAAAVRNTRFRRPGDSSASGAPSSSASVAAAMPKHAAEDEATAAPQLLPLNRRVCCRVDPIAQRIPPFRSLHNPDDQRQCTATRRTRRRPNFGPSTPCRAHLAPALQPSRGTGRWGHQLHIARQMSAARGMYQPWLGPTLSLVTHSKRSTPTAVATLVHRCHTPAVASTHEARVPHRTASSTWPGMAGGDTATVG